MWTFSPVSEHVPDTDSREHYVIFEDTPWWMEFADWFGGKIAFGWPSRIRYPIGNAMIGWCMKRQRKYEIHRLPVSLDDYVRISGEDAADPAPRPELP